MTSAHLGWLLRPKSDRFLTHSKPQDRPRSPQVPDDLPVVAPPTAGERVHFTPKTGGT